VAVCQAFRQQLRDDCAAGGRLGITELVRRVATQSDPALAGLLSSEMQSKLQRVFEAASAKSTFAGPDDCKPAIAADNVWRVLRKTARLAPESLPRPYSSNEVSAATVRRRLSAGVPAGSVSKSFQQVTGERRANKPTASAAASSRAVVVGAVLTGTVSPVPPSPVNLPKHPVASDARSIKCLPEVTRLVHETLESVWRYDERFMHWGGSKTPFPSFPSIGLSEEFPSDNLSRYVSDCVSAAELEQLPQSLRERAAAIAARLELATCIDDGFDCAVFNISRAEEALKEHGGRKSQLPFCTRQAVLSWASMPSFTCSESSLLAWVFRGGAVRLMTFRERLSVMLPPFHGVSRALVAHAAQDSRSFSEALRAGSQGVQYDLARRVIERGIELAGFRDELLSCSACFAGVSTFEVGLSLARPMGFIMKWIADDVRVHWKIHGNSGWPTNGPIRYHPDAESDSVALEERTDIHFNGQPCGWISSNHRTKRKDSKNPFSWETIYENVTQLRRSLRYVATARPRLVFLETVSRLYDKPKHLARLKFEDSLRSISGYRWYSDIMSPDTHAGVPCHRERLFWIGVLDSSSGDAGDS
jgi:hypothetical protein